MAKRTCTEEACDRPLQARGYCLKHYKIAAREGTLHLAPRFEWRTRPAPSPEQRFWAKVVKTETCWLWDGAKIYGYGSFAITRRRHIRAHRFAYELLVGPIPKGLTIDHLCHNDDKTCRGGPTCPHRQCVNPEHLAPATNRENTLRSPMQPAAVNARKTHCKRGHPFDGANTGTSKDGTRYCRACERGRKHRRGWTREELIA